MEREVAQSVYIGVTMMALAIVISLVMFTVYIGNDVKKDAIDKAVAIGSCVSVAQLSSLNGRAEIMPKASAYVIIAKEYRGIKKFIYDGIEYLVNSKGYWTEDGYDYADDMYPYIIDIIDKQGIEGKAEMIVSKLAEGKFNVILNSVDMYNY